MLAASPSLDYKFLIICSPGGAYYSKSLSVYVEDKFSSGFKFNNPNEVSACGCGESVEIVPLDTVTKVSTAS